MAKNECTAINDLLHRMASPQRDSEESIQTVVRIPGPPPPPLQMPQMPARPAARLPKPTPASPARVPLAIRMTTASESQALAMPSIAPQIAPRIESTDAEKTMAISRRHEIYATLDRLAVPILGVAIASAILACYIAVRTSRTDDSPQPAPAAALEPAPAVPKIAVPPLSPVASVALARTAPDLVEIRFDSKPAGAGVTLVDNGKASFLGTTPMRATVDRAHQYDVMFKLDGHPTQLEHLDPNAMHYLSIVLGTTQTSPVAEVKAPPPASAPVAVAAHARQLAVTVPHRASSPPAASAVGVLMVSTKPPCEILVDGKRIGLTTPQRALSLSAGSHRIGLVNASQNIKSTADVEITPTRPIKLIRNFMRS